MRFRSLMIAAAVAFAAPVAAHAADLSGYFPVGPNCGGLQPVDVYVPPQVAYIVACTVALPPPIVVAYEAPAKHGHWAKLLGGHGAAKEEVVVVEQGGLYGPHATHDAERYEGKLVYLNAWSADRPPVHFLVVPK